MVKIMREVTEWRDVTHRPNHVYLMNGDKVYAYSAWGEVSPHYMKTFLRIDRRGRKFVEVKDNPWKFDLSVGVEPEETPSVPSGQTWTVVGSKGNSYTVSLSGSVWSCSCPGHGFRGRCRHVDDTRASSPQLG